MYCFSPNVCKPHHASDAAADTHEGGGAGDMPVCTYSLGGGSSPCSARGIKSFGVLTVSVWWVHIADNPIRRCDDLRTPLCAAQNAQLHQRASDWWHARGGCRTSSRDSTRVTATRLARGESTHNIPTRTLCVRRCQATEPPRFADALPAVASALQPKAPQALITRTGSAVRTEHRPEAAVRGVQRRTD